MSPTMDRRAARQLEAALLALLRKYPMHAGVIRGELFTADPSVRTMCVLLQEQRIVYRYAPSFVLECTLEELTGVLHHEVNHVLFEHPRADPRLYPNRQARIIAEEITVNEHVPEPLPGEPLRLEQFPYLPPGEDTDTRYRRLAERDDLPSDPRSTDNHHMWLAGEHLTDEDVLRIFSDIRSLWELPEHLREPLVERVKRAERRGRPDRRRAATIETLGQAVSSPRPLDWKLLLQRAAGFSPRQEVTFGRPSRRAPHLPGIVPGTRLQPHRPRIMAAIDTSSSMRRGHLQHVLRELRQLDKLGAVTVVECDNQVRGTYPLRGRIEQLAGRGSTDLRPPFAPDRLAAVKPEIVVYFTDGEGPAPAHSPRVPVIWCLTAGGRRPADWGLAVELPGTPAAAPPPRADISPRENGESDNRASDNRESEKRANENRASEEPRKTSPQPVNSNTGRLWVRSSLRTAGGRRSRRLKLRQEMLARGQDSTRVVLDCSPTIPRNDG